MSCGPSGTTSTCACRISERPVLVARTVDADDDRRLRMLVRKSRAPGVTRNGVAIHAEALHGVAAVAQRPEDEVLDRVLVAAQGTEPHEVLRVCDLLGKALLDRGDDACAHVRIDSRRHC